MAEIDNDFVATSFEEFYEIYEEQDFENEYYDVIFNVQGKELYAHSLILARESPVFKQLFIKNSPIRNEPIIIDDYCYDEFSEFLRCIYCPYSNLEINEEKMFPVIELAELYKVERIKEFVDDYYLHIDVTDIEQAFMKIEFAYKYSLKGYEFMVGLEEIDIPALIEYEDFVHLEKSVIEAFTFYTKDCDEEADQICKMVYKWGEYRAIISDEMIEKEKNKLVLNEIKDFFENFNFKQMSVGFLFEFAIKKDLISIEKIIKNTSLPYHRDISEIELLCKKIYEWGEERAKITKETSEKEKNQIVLHEIKDFLSFLKFEKMSIEFLFDFAIEKDLISIKEVVGNAVSREVPEIEELCKSVYKWGKEQAKITKEMPKTEKNELVLNEIKEFIPLLPFEKMSIKFLDDFVVWKNLLSNNQANKYRQKYVRIETPKGQILDGSFIDDYGIYDYSLENILRMGAQSKLKACCKDHKFKIPSIPSTVEKMKGCDWYLLFDKNRMLVIKHESLINKKDDYLIAESSVIRFSRKDFLSSLQKEINTNFRHLNFKM